MAVAHCTLNAIYAFIIQLIHFMNELKCVPMADPIRNLTNEVISMLFVQSISRI